MPPPQMSILNAPTRESCIARRERTNTPLQALLLLNEQQFLEASRHLAFQYVNEKSLNDEKRLEALFETVTGDLPDTLETAQLLKLVADMKTTYEANLPMAQKLCDGLELTDGVQASDVAAWTLLVSTLHNLDRTKTRN